MDGYSTDQSEGQEVLPISPMAGIYLSQLQDIQQQQKQQPQQQQQQQQQTPEEDEEVFTKNEQTEQNELPSHENQQQQNNKTAETTTVIIEHHPNVEEEQQHHQQQKRQKQQQQNQQQQQDSIGTPSPKDSITLVEKNEGGDEHIKNSSLNNITLTLKENHHTETKQQPLTSSPSLPSSPYHPPPYLESDLSPPQVVKQKSQHPLQPQSQQQPQLQPQSNQQPKSQPQPQSQPQSQQQRAHPKQHHHHQQSCQADEHTSNSLTNSLITALRDPAKPILCFVNPQIHKEATRVSTNFLFWADIVLSTNLVKNCVSLAFSNILFVAAWLLLEFNFS